MKKAKGCNNMANVKDSIKNLLVKNELYNAKFEREFYDATETDLIIYACDSIRKKMKEYRFIDYEFCRTENINFEEYAKRYCTLEDLAYNYQYQAFSVPYKSSRYKFKGLEKVDGGRIMFETLDELDSFINGLEPYSESDLYLVDYLENEDFYCYGRDSVGVIKYTKTFTLETKTRAICKLEVLLDGNNDLLSVKILKNDNLVKYVRDDDIRKTINFLNEMNKAKKTKNPIKYLRCLKKMPLSELSNKSSISITLLALYETGKIKPQNITLGTLMKLSVGLGMKTKDIYNAIVAQIDTRKVLNNEKD